MSVDTNKFLPHYTRHPTPKSLIDNRFAVILVPFNLESKFRQTIGSNRSAIAGVQDDLSISLGRIASQYSQTKAKKLLNVQTETAKKEPTPYEEQTTSLVDRFRQLREARYSGSSLGITQRIKSANS
uniref:Uncharacterized protein n=1 Tax=Nostoc flagelliforme str. Sunitezuoqi TaxID=676037 RepID=E7DQ91_9NOSO|nr:hypothetical protein Nfla_7901 [Nostoc flagelliforme str. Sunitezuoqi]